MKTIHLTDGQAHVLSQTLRVLQQGGATDKDEDSVINDVLSQINSRPKFNGGEIAGAMLADPAEFARMLQTLALRDPALEESNCTTLAEAVVDYAEFKWVIGFLGDLLAEIERIEEEGL